MGCVLQISARVKRGQLCIISFGPEGVGDIISGSIVLKSTEISDDELIRIEEGLNLPSATGRTELLHVKKSSVVGTS